VVNFQVLADSGMPPLLTHRRAPRHSVNDTQHNDNQHKGIKGLYVTLSITDTLVNSFCILCLLIEGRHDTQHNNNQHNDIKHNGPRHNDTQYKGLISETQHKGHICDARHN